MENWKKAENDFKAAFDRLGKSAVVVRFADTAEAKVLNGRKAYSRSQPSDFLVVVDGETFFAEVKSSEKEVSFPFSGIQPYQWAKSRQIVAADGLYFFFLKSECRDQWFKVPAQVLHQAEKKSIRWDNLKGYEWYPNTPM